MTAVLSYVNDYCSIILVDNRITYGRNGEGGYADNVNKLVDLESMGWASGAGFSDYLVEAKKELTKLVATSTDDIKDIYRRVIKNCKEKYPLYKDDIDESVLIASWIGSSTGDLSDIFFRVGSLSNKHYGDKFQFVKKGFISIAYPYDYVTDISKVEHLEEKFNFGPEEDLNLALKNMLNIFNDISSTSPQVSRTCDIGIQIIRQNGIFKLKHGGHVEELIKDLDNNTFESKMEVISVMELQM